MGAAVGALALAASLVTPAAAYARPGATERVSVSSEGAEADGTSRELDISADGRSVAFASGASNLVPGDTNGVWDVFVHDRHTGVTERVSVAGDGTEGDSDSFMPAVSADGRYVAFASFASNLVPDTGDGALHVYVHDRETGTTERVSVASDGTEGDGWSEFPAISADGRHVAFHSAAANLVPGDTNGVDDVFVHDRETGATQRVSVASNGGQGNARSRAADISGDGRYVSFRSDASNLVAGDTNGFSDVFVHDRETGATERVSVATDGAEGDHVAVNAAISGDGRYVAFESQASNLAPRNANPFFDIYVHDRETGTTERVSVASSGAEGTGAFLGPAISGDGRHVAFFGQSTDLVPHTTNNTHDVFVHDRDTGVAERVSVASDGAEGDGPSMLVAISGDGRHVAFESNATNLVPGDTNDAWDIFVRDRGPATGIGDLHTEPAGDVLAVSGWATFSGTVVAAAGDVAGDGETDLGAEITGASITHRVEEEDVLLRLQLSGLHGGGRPGVLYGWSFTAGETAYEVRARPGATSAPQTTEPYFALYTCDLVCEETAGLAGGIGTTAAEVRVAVPLEAVGAGPGDTLADVEAWTAVGEATTGPVAVLDEVALPDAAIPTPRVELGVTPAGDAADVVYSSAAALRDGAFSGEVDVAALPAGDYRVWARACLGETCGAGSLAVTHVPGAGEPPSSPDTGADLHATMLDAGPAARAARAEALDPAQEFWVYSLRPDARWIALKAMDVSGFDEPYLQLSVGARLMRDGQVQEEWLPFDESVVVWKLLYGPAEDPYRHLTTLVMDTPWGMDVALPQTEVLTIVVGAIVDRDADLGLVFGAEGVAAPRFEEPDMSPAWLASWTDGKDKVRLVEDAHGVGVEVAAWFLDTHHRGVDAEDERVRVLDVPGPGPLSKGATHTADGPAWATLSLTYSTNAGHRAAFEWRTPGDVQRGEGLAGPGAPLSIRAREPAAGHGATSFHLDLLALTAEQNRTVSYLQDHFALDADEVFGSGFDSRFEATFTEIPDLILVVPRRS